MRYSKKTKAFTLIELMVTIAIMGIMAAIAMPSMSAFVAKSRINNRADQVANLFRYARAEAIRLNTPVIVCGDTIRKDGRPKGTCNASVFDNADTASQSAALRIFADKNRDGQYDSNSDIALRTIAINNGNRKNIQMDLFYCPVSTSITCSVVGDTTKQMIFFPDGRFGVKTGATLNDVTLLSHYIQFRLRDNNKSDDDSRLKLVVVSPSGSVKACSSKKGNSLDKELCS